MENNYLSSTTKIICNNGTVSDVVGTGTNNCYYNSICGATTINNLKDVINAVVKIKKTDQISSRDSTILFVEYELVISYRDCSNRIREKSIFGFTVFLNLPLTNVRLVAQTINSVGIVRCRNQVKVTSKIAVCY